MINGESLLTKAVREALERRGAHCMKVSDRFTRGIPDLFVTTDRLIAIEFKVFVTALTVIGWREAGLSGAQDHHLRRIARRARRASCVITGPPSEASVSAIKLWVPVRPEVESDDGVYRLAAVGEEAMKWVLG